MPGMTHEALAAKLTHLLPRAQANPRAYRHRVRAWILLGYLFILVLLLSSAGLLGGLIWGALALGTLALKLLIPVFYFVWKILRSLWVKLEPPTGRVLSRAEAAPLHALLRAQTQALRAPTVHRILLTTDYNAAAVQRPRLGILGWQRNYVLVGLPLLQTLSPAQAAAVVAHELGHLRGGHGRFAAWVYRVNQSWGQLLNQFERGSRRSVVHRFADWYVPHFHAWSHPLRRAAEFEADAAAAHLTSPAAMAEALCAMEVRRPALQRLFWAPLDKSVAHVQHPPADSISRLLAVARTAQLPPEEAATLLRRATNAEPDPFDTHPTLGERLAALHQLPAAPALPTTTAAEAWLGASLPALTQELDTEWAAERLELWQQRHAQLSTQHQRLAELSAQHAAGQALSDADAWLLADYTEDHVGEAEALPLFRALFGSARHDGPARFAVGRILTTQDDAAGLPLLEEAMHTHPNFVRVGLALQQDYHERHGNREVLRQLLTRQYQHTDLTRLVQAERQGFTPQDTLLAHGLPAEELVPLRTLLADPARRVAQAWLMRKQLTHLATEKPYFLLLLRASRGPGIDTDEEIEAWYEQLVPSITLPGQGIVVPVIRAYRWAGSRALHLDGCEIYRADPS